MHGWDADRGGVERARCGEALFDGGEGGDAEFCCGFGGGGGVAVDDGGELDGLAGLFEFAVDTEMIAPEGARSDNGDAGVDLRGTLLLVSPVFDGGFDCLAAADVEFEEFLHLIVGLGGRTDAEAGGSWCLAAYVGLGGDELEEVERDVFSAARCVDRFHECSFRLFSVMLMGWGVGCKFGGWGGGRCSG